MKKIFLTLLSLIVLSIFIASCAPNEELPKENITEKPTPEGTTEKPAPQKEVPTSGKQPAEQIAKPTEESAQASGCITTGNPPNRALPSSANLPPITDLSGKLVIASYYLWYGYKKANWLEDIGEHPIFGNYCSYDQNYIDAALSMANDAGINAFVVSWGWSGKRPVPDNFKNMLNMINSSPYYRNFKLGIYFESVNDNPQITNQELIDAFSYVTLEYSPHPAMLKIEGRPVIFIYASQHVSIERWQQVYDGVQQRTGIKPFLVSAPDNWEYDNLNDFISVFDSIATYADKYTQDNEILNKLSQVATRKSAIRPVISTMFGGGGRVQKLGFDIDRSNGNYINQRLNLAQQAGADWISITSWNEWYEGNQVEPSREYGFETVKYIREALAAFKSQALTPLTGAAITYTKSETTLSVTNIGTINVYYITYGPAAGKMLVAYVLHPGETVSTSRSGQPEEVSGYLVDNTLVQAMPSS